MSNGFNGDQINKLNSLGIEIGMGTVGQKQSINFSKNKTAWYLVPMVGLGLAGIGIGLSLTKKDDKTSQYVEIKQTDGSVVARTTPAKTSSSSIQQHLLSSQQYFSQALQVQSSGGSNQEVVDFLNKSIDEASQAVANFPDDFRSWQQRGKIYQSLVSQGDQLTEQDSSFLKQAISDLSKSYQLNNDSVEVNRSLASMYARVGDANNTIRYLTEAIRIEPTKAQNFYDLAKIQSQSGQVAGALETYKQLIWLVSDNDQKEILEKEKIALEKILAENPDLSVDTKIGIVPSPTGELERDGPVIKASTDNGVVIAAYEDREEMEVSGMTESNSMSGTAILANGQTEVEIENSNLSASTQVYVSAIKGGKNQVLRVKSKTDSSFKVGLDLAIGEDIEFKWWIIN